MSFVKPTSADRPSRHRVYALLAGLAPGVLAGVHVAALLFYLNPDVPFTAGRFLRGALLYGCVLGIASLLLLVPLARRSPALATRLLPWSITAVLFAVATLGWIHASRFAYYLPGGINDRLIKASIWFIVFSLAAFYTALLHAVYRRPYGHRSIVGVVIFALLSVFVSIERRAAYQRPASPAPLATVVTNERTPSLLVLGLEGASAEIILPLVEQGHLPTFARLIQEGSVARLRSYPPTDRTALWTTLATGRLPYQHGLPRSVLHSAPFLEPLDLLRIIPYGIGFRYWGTLGQPARPATAADRHSPTAWEILGRMQIPTGFVGWPASHPVPDDLSFGFSELFFSDSVAPGTATPRELSERGRLFQSNQAEVDATRVELLGPEGSRLTNRAIAGDLWRESLSLFLIEQKPETRALMVLLPGLREVSRQFLGGFSAARFDGSKLPRNLEAAEHVDAYYRHLDDYLHRLLQRESPPELIAVVSAWGVSVPEGLPRLVYAATNRPLQGIDSNASDGIMILHGGGIRAGEFLERADLPDVLPTLLYGLGLPIARDLDGKVLTSAFESSHLATHPLTFVPSYKTVTASGPEAPPADLP